MTVPHAIGVGRTSSRIRIVLAVSLLVLGLLAHVFAAHAIGGSGIAYRDHIFGFFFILLVTGAIIAAAGWRFWRGRRDVMLLVIGAVQALLGLVIYLRRFDIA